MFEPANGDSSPLTQAAAERRSTHETLVEMFQHKGSSECHPLSSPNDEFCAFEQLKRAELFNNASGSLVPSALDFIRPALEEGLRQHDLLGANPFKLGFVGGTDGHNSNPGATVEEDFADTGHLGVRDAIPENMLSRIGPGGVVNNAGGLTVLWAEENSRDALFAAMRRREAYATSGTRPIVRFFGGRLPEEYVYGIIFIKIGALMNFIGLDAGSVSVKLVVLDEKGDKLFSRYDRHKGHPIRVALELLGEVNSSFTSSFFPFSLSVTGSSGKLIASILTIAPVNEIVAQSHATSNLFPHIKTIIEMGGEDSKLIFLDRDGKSGTIKISDFIMNAVCAAGTGSFLDQQAHRLGLTVEEFGRLALQSKNPPRIAGRCSVFAKTDMIHLQQSATPDYDIVAGLCSAVARNFKSTLGRGKSFTPPVSFQGGVAANLGTAA